MIDEIQYNNLISAIIFNEPVGAYRDILLNAASDNSHKLHKNYKSDFIHETFFCVIVYYDNEPMEIFGLEKSDLDPKAGRGYYRAYKPKDIRERRVGADWETSRFVMNFYQTYPYYHQQYGVDTIYMTRNYKQQNKNFARYLKKSHADYYDYAGTYLYRKQPQDFYVWGRKEILSDLPIYEPDKESR